MSVHCVKITFENNEIAICNLFQEISRASNVAKLKYNEHCAVYIFANEHLDVICQHVDFVIDLGFKNNAIQLTRYFAPKKKMEKIPLLRSDYSSKKRMINAIKHFFRSIEGREDVVRAYIIGAEKNCFDKILAECPLSATDSTEFRLLPFLEKLYGVSLKLEKKYQGGSELVRFVRALILVAAKAESPVLILGDVRTGKNVVAHAIHENSSRKYFGFTVFECGKISSELLEYELFGCEKNFLYIGQPLKIGLWERAGQGSLFFDGIDGLSLDHQAKILDVLEKGAIKRMGGNKEITAKARVLAASNRNLFEMVQDNRFNKALYYSLRGYFIRTPSLKDHIEDIPVLALHFWQKITGNVKAALSPDILEELCRYAWPGNGRELKNLLTKLFSFFRKEKPDIDELKDVFCLFGKKSLCSSKSLSMPGYTAGFQKAIYLQHLRQIHEIIESCRYKINKILTELLTSAITLSQAREALYLILYEIELPYGKPPLLQNQEISSAFNDFKEIIYHLLRLLDSEKHIAIDYLETYVINFLDDLLSLIIREIEKVKNVKL